MRRVLAAAAPSSSSSNSQGVNNSEIEEEGSINEEDMEEIGVIIRSIKNDITGIKVILFKLIFLYRDAWETRACSVNPHLIISQLVFLLDLSNLSLKKSRETIL